MKSKKVSAMALTLVMAISMMSTPAWAAYPPSNVSPENGIIVSPFWENTSSAYAQISASGKTITVGARIQAKATSTAISGTLYLEKKSGSSWQTVTSWSISGTGTLNASKTYTGVAGTTYRSRAVVSVGGENVECMSSECKI